MAERKAKSPYQRKQKTPYRYSPSYYSWRSAVDRNVGVEEANANWERLNGITSKTKGTASEDDAPWHDTYKGTARSTPIITGILDL